jgi:hypothetical protein
MEIKRSKTGTDASGARGSDVTRKRPLHRIRAIRQQQGISLRCAARRLNQNVDDVRFQEDETSDIPLTTLYQWQQLLEVPIADLLVEMDSGLSEPVLKRARMVRIMKTAASILEHVESVPIRRLAQMLVDQLVEIMPELKEVSAWHTVGQRRTLDEVGRIAENPFPDTLFHDAALY